MRRNLEKGAPEEIEGQVAAGEEKERDLGRALEGDVGNPRSARGKTGRRRRRGGGGAREIVVVGFLRGVVLEAEEGEEAERDGEGDDELPAEPEHVAGGEWWEE